MDGLYVIRTSEPVRHLSPENVVRGYKRLSQVERVFRCMKGTDLRVRPIFLRTKYHVHAHFYMLAYYVDCQMRHAPAPLLFQDEDVSAVRRTRDPVAPAR